MKLAFVTDCHFGYRRFESDAHNQGREALLAAASEADLVILGGDNFDVPIPRMETISSVAGMLREAHSIFRARGIAGVPIYAIHGNHDRRAKGYVNPTELLAQAGLLRYLHNETVVHDAGGEKVAISGLGSVPEDLAGAALESLACKPVEGAFNVFVLHQSFQEFDRMKSEKYISFEDLPEGHDLYLCGHVHQKNLGTKVLNPGSTVVTQLREDEIGQRGWLLYDTKARKAEFRPIKSRELSWMQLDFDRAAPEEIRSRVEQEAKKLLASDGNKLVKLVIKGTLADGFQSSDLRLSHLGDSVFIDNSLNSENLRERIAQIKAAREKKLSSKEMGMELLRKKLEGTAYSLDDPEKVYEELLDGSLLGKLKGKIEAKN